MTTRRMGWMVASVALAGILAVGIASAAGPGHHGGNHGHGPSGGSIHSGAFYYGGSHGVSVVRPYAGHPIVVQRYSRYPLVPGTVYRVYPAPRGMHQPPIVIGPSRVPSHGHCPGHGGYGGAGISYGTSYASPGVEIAGGVLSIVNGAIKAKQSQSYNWP